MTLHRLRRSTLSNEKIQETYATSKKKSSCPDSLPKTSKSFDEDGYLSPMEIKAKVRRRRISLKNKPSLIDQCILLA